MTSAHHPTARILPPHFFSGWKEGIRMNLLWQIVCSSSFARRAAIPLPLLPQPQVCSSRGIMAEAAKPAGGEEPEYESDPEDALRPCSSRGIMAEAAKPAGGEEPEYESDPEDALRPSAMRRREASDDDEEGGERSDGGGEPAQEDRRIGAIGPDGDSDGEGGAPGYDEEEEFEEEEDEYEEDVEGDNGELLEEEVEVAAYDGGEDGGCSGGVGRADVPADGVESCGDSRALCGEKGAYTAKDQLEEKESEPFAVPIAGAFYMHDDRFRENAGGRHSRRGGRRLWESGDDRKWVHDRFDEMNLRDALNEEKRTSKRNFRGRGRSHVPNRGSIRGNRYDGSHAYDDGYQSYKNHTLYAYDDSGIQNHTRKTVRGRGRQYDPLPKNDSKQPETKNKQSGKSNDATSNTTTSRSSPSTSNVKVEETYPQKHVFTSSLNSASPPFYPSGSSNPDGSATLRRDAHTVNNSLNLSLAVTEDNPSQSNASATLRGTAIHDSLRQQGRLYVNDIGLGGGESLPNLQLPSSSSLPPIKTTRTEFKGLGRGFTVTGQADYQPTSSVSHRGRASGSAQIQLSSVQKPQTSIQPLIWVSSEQSVQRPSTGSQVSFPSQAQLTNSSEVVEAESPSESGKSKIPEVLKGKTNNQESGRGSLMCSGGSGAGLAHGDQSFPATPALLPVMQFGGQHRGRLGVPAVGMALPGYVAHGFGNSEMTWVPVLAGAAGGLAASYGPYIALDGSYCARLPEQTPSAVGSRETSTTKTANVYKTPQRPEVVNDEFGQRQNKPRRYSEMNFGQ